MDEIVVFDPLSHEQLRKVCRLQLKDVAIRLAERGIALGVSEVALDVVLAERYDPVSFTSHISNLATQIMFDKMAKLPLFFCMCNVCSRCMVQDRLGDGWRRRW